MAEKKHFEERLQTVEAGIQEIVLALNEWRIFFKQQNKILNETAEGIQQQCQQPAKFHKIFETVVLPVSSDLEQTAKRLEELEAQGYIVANVQQHRDAFFESREIVLRRLLFLQPKLLENQEQNLEPQGCT